MSSMKLTYFNLRGLAETSRYMLHMAGAKYEDCRYPIDVAAGFAKPEYDADKATGKFAANMHRVPILTVDGMDIAQSKPVARYIARKFGFMGENDVEAAQVDATATHIDDINAAYQKIRGMTNEEEKKAAMDKWFSTELAEWFTKLDAAIAVTSKASGCSVGSKISYADIVIYYFCTFFFDNKDGVAAALKPCEKISAICAAVGSNDKVKEWESTRPVTAM